MSEALSAVLAKLENLGREQTRPVKLGEHSLVLSPISTQQEIEAYQIATEESKGVPSLQASGLQVGPEYILFLKTRVLAQAIQSLDDVPILDGTEVKDIQGNKREAREYLLRILRSWPSEVVSYIFVEYNHLQIDMSKAYEFTLTHRAIMSSLDQLLKVSAEMAQGTNLTDSLASEVGEDLSESDLNGAGDS